MSSKLKVKKKTRFPVQTSNQAAQAFGRSIQICYRQIKDVEQQAYFGIDGTDAWAEDEAKKKLKQMTKDELISAVRQCFKIYQSYVGLQNRYDSLKAAIDILRDKNTGILQVIREIEKLYEAANEKQGIYAEYSEEWKEFDRYANALPQEAWIA